MFEKLLVIPLYVAVLRVTDLQTNHVWDLLAYIGTEYESAFSGIGEASREHEPKDTTKVKAFIIQYHIKADGKMVYVLEEEVGICNTNHSFRSRTAHLVMPRQDLSLGPAQSLNEQKV